MATVTVAWNPVTVDTSGQPISGVSYSVYRDGVLAQAGITGTSWQDTVAAGVTASYRVKAAGPGGESAFSVAVSYTAGTGVPVPPDGVTVS